MTARVPGFLRRPWLLYQARRAIERGAHDTALGFLRDPCLDLSIHAAWMRGRTLEVLCRLAAQRAAAGRAASTARILEMVEREDPERAEEWRSRLGERRDEAPPAPPAGAPGFVADGAEHEPVAAALERLLAEMRRARGADATAATPPPEPRAPRRALPRIEAGLFLLAFDEGGEFLVATGEELVLGHLRSPEADLAFLADLEAQHARLSWDESFHAGPSWCIAPVSGARVELGGRTLAESGAALGDGDVVRLGSNLAFRFTIPDPSSSSAVLELLHGAECFGAARVILLVPGEGGRLAIGRRGGRHVRVAELEHEVSVRRDGARLVLRCDAGLWQRAEHRTGAARELAVPCPPPQPIDVEVAGREQGRPPFAISLRPLARRLPRAAPPSAGGGA